MTAPSENDFKIPRPRHKTIQWFAREGVWAQFQAENGKQGNPRESKFKHTAHIRTVDLQHDGSLPEDGKSYEAVLLLKTEEDVKALHSIVRRRAVLDDDGALYYDYTALMGKIAGIAVMDVAVHVIGWDIESLVLWSQTAVVGEVTSTPYIQPPLPADD
jgi:hypothetical protein